MHATGLISCKPVETLLSHSLKKLQSDLDLYTFTFTVAFEPLSCSHKMSKSVSPLFIAEIFSENQYKGESLKI